MIGKIYDTKNKRFTSLLAPVALFIMAMILFFIGGLFVGMASFFLFSFFASGIAFVAVINNHWILNSFSVPLSILFVMVAANDAFLGNYGPCVFHASTAALAIYVLSTRINTSFVIMSLSSILYAVWVLSVILFMGEVYYTEIFGVPIPDGTMFFMTIIAAFIPSIIATVKNATLQKRGRVMDCDGGYCPY